MANRWWVGGPGSQSFQNTANWSTTQGGAGGAAVPVDGDNIYIVDGTSDIDQGLSNASLDPGRLEIRFSGTIGTAGNPLVLGTVTSGFGTTFILDCQNSSFVNLTASIAGGYANVVSAAQTMRLTGGTYNTIACGTAGILTIGGTTAITNGTTTGELTTAGMGIVLENGSGAIDKVTVMGGSVENHRSSGSVGSVTIGPLGVFINESDAGAPAVVTHGRFIHRNSNNPQIIVAYPGCRCTAQGSLVPFGVNTVYRYPGARVFETETVTVTIGSTYKLGYL